MQNPLKHLHDFSDFPVEVRREMYALAKGAIRVLSGKEEARTYPC